MTRTPDEVIAAADNLLRIFAGSGMLRHEDLIREMRDRLKDLAEKERP